MEDTVLNITLKKSLSAVQSPTQVPAHAPVDAGLLFKGPEQMPFLAPRGVFIVDNHLFVSDTGRNRVFIWKSLPTAPNSEPDVVLGQDDSSATERNAGGQAGASSLQYPSGIWSDGTRLIVADAWNHRVLIWHTMPTEHGQPADVVLGQPDFGHNEPNVKGVGAKPGPNTLYWPYGVFSDGKSLWIADTGNRRILFFEQIPLENGAPADAVIGKPDFYTRDYENEDPIWPYSIKISAEGSMVVADTQYYRVLFWRNWRDAFTQKAETVVGQPDLDSNGMNQFGLAPAAHTLSWCYDACFYQKGLLVADAGNSRVLRFSEIPVQSSPTADGLIGKPDFNTGSENAETVFGTDQNLYWPFSICPQGNLLAVADTGNHRIIFYDLSSW
jgi:hypothetical protein